MTNHENKHRTPFALLVLGAALAMACGGPPPDTPELRQEKALEVARLEVEKGGLDEALDSGADYALAASLDALADLKDKE